MKPLDPADVEAAWREGRRQFLRDLAAAGGSIAGGSLLAGCGAPPAPPTAASPSPVAASTPVPTPLRIPLRTTVTTCDHNCGGRCVMEVTSENGRILRITTDDGRASGRAYGEDPPEDPQIRACLRGRAYRGWVHHPDRILTPLLRVGARGGGQWKPLSWDQAYQLIIDRLQATREQHGPFSVFGFNGTGTRSLINNAGLLRVFLAMQGPFTTYWNAYSWEGAHFAQEMTLGLTNQWGGPFKDGNEADDHLNSKLILCWGWDPAQTIFGTNTPFHLTRARERGIPFVFVDPCFTDSAALWGGRWIPIRPGTDTAMLLAMAHVIVDEGLWDKPYVAKFVHGFSEFRDHLKGASDGIEKSPRWAEGICGVAAATIASLAREFARARPAALLHSWAPGRTAQGEQFHRAGLALQALTGNIGRRGGSASGSMETPKFRMPGVLDYMLQDLIKSKKLARPLEIMGDKVADAILLGPKADPVELGVDRPLPSEIKFLWANGSNFVNQMCNLNKIVRAVHKLDFMVVHDSFLTPTARLADLVLPATTFIERDDLSAQWLKGRYVIAMQAAIPPIGESKSDFEVFAELSQRMNLPWAMGMSVRDAVRGLIGGSEIQDPATFVRTGLAKVKAERPWVAFQPMIEDAPNHPFGTPTGKIEILSTAIARIDSSTSRYRRPIPPLPTYLPTYEGVEDEEAKARFPLQVITAKFKIRVHSTQVLNPWLTELHRHELWLATADALTRGIRDGDMVEAFNDRGRTRLRARVTPRILPGVIKMWEGPWFDPGADGVDRGGNPNLLTRDEPSPGGAYAFNTLRCEVKKV